MKKYDFLIYHKDYQSFLLKLRELGVVHIVQKQFGTIAEDSDLAKWLNKEKRYHEIIRNLDRINTDKKIKELKAANPNSDGDKILENVEALFDEKEKLQLEKQGIQKEIERIVPFGDFEPAYIQRLEEKGWYMHLHTVSESKFDTQWIEDYNAITLENNGSQICFATFTKQAGAPPIEAEHIRISDKSMSEWKMDLKQIENRTAEIANELVRMAKEDIETLRYYEKIVNDHINFEKVELSGDAAAGEKLMILEGYVPVEHEPQTTESLLKEALYFNVSTPTPEDNPPIKLKNNRFAKTFELIADLYDKPQYGTYDYTAFFAPFYILFFGLCLGDCGYGMLIFLISLYLRRSKDEFMRSAGNLASYLGIGTMIFGFLSGTFFGIPLLEVDWNWIQPLKKIMLDSDKLFWLALIIGGIQISYALTIKTITQWMRFGVLYALDTFGWLLTIVGNAAIYFLAEQGIINAEIQPLAHKIVTACGVFLMLFFNNVEKGVKGIPGSIGSGLFGLYNKIVGLLGDMLSYIRLFALGISGSVMGLVFNKLAVGFAPDIIIVRELVMILILLFGHGINIAINSIGSFVHPMRLTFVEFYNNVGFEGGGKPYTPFRINTPVTHHSSPVTNNNNKQ
ncbi:MAG: V-type ATP synthase subunit I [Bacteroidetes bacterium]|nr:V-type ATP synthase subunit I [Bacteroidota bacterium]MCL1968878.1 V-type ATP synthase subunit I [Bacteroidota bacterium]MCL1968993.1 V-type ATP synthase subunit I [Bacteroidota bacterium]